MTEEKESTGKTEREEALRERAYELLSRTEFPGCIMELLETLEGAGHEAWLVGGCVRDALLERTPADYDVTTSALPMEVARLFKCVKNTGEAFGGVTVAIGGRGVEVTTYRSEHGYSDGRHPDSITPAATLEEDVKRRDFTIGTVCWNPCRGLVDLCGGVSDIRDGVIRCVGEPEDRFSEDALRIIRAARFAAQLGFYIEPETGRAMTKCAGRLTGISRERVGSEIMKLITARWPQKLGVLANSGSLEYLLIHPEREWERLEGAPSSPAARLACLCELCDVTPGDYKTRLKLSGAVTEEAAKLIQIVRNPPAADRTSLKTAMSRTPPERLRTALRLLSALTGEDTTQARAVTEEIEASGEPYSTDRLAVNGSDLLNWNIRPELIGGCLRELLTAVIREPKLNTATELRKICDAYLAYRQ